MRAVVAAPNSVAGFGFEDVPRPTPTPEEAVVTVRAISLNRGEIHRLGSAQPGWRPGWDFAGVVKQAAQDGAGPTRGQRVVGFLAGGAWAEEVAAPASRLAVLPDDVSFADAATLPVAGLTALRTLRFGGLLLGKRVLITGAAGGVGRCAIQLASHGGANVIGVARNEDRAAGLRDLGAKSVVYSIDDVSDSCDLILESVGGTSLATALQIVAPHGTVVTFGNSSRQETTFNISNFYNHDDAQLRAFFLLGPDQSPFDQDLALLVSLIAQGKLKPEIGLEERWDNLGRAITALRDRQVAGKAVVTMGD